MEGRREEGGREIRKGKRGVRIGSIEEEREGGREGGPYMYL